MYSEHDTRRSLLRDRQPVNGSVTTQGFLRDKAGKRVSCTQCLVTCYQALLRVIPRLEHLMSRTPQQGGRAPSSREGSRVSSGSAQLRLTTCKPSSQGQAQGDMQTEHSGVTWGEGAPRVPARVWGKAPLHAGLCKLLSSTQVTQQTGGPCSFLSITKSSVGSESDSKGLLHPESLIFVSRIFAMSVLLL